MNCSLFVDINDSLHQIYRKLFFSKILNLIPKDIKPFTVLSKTDRYNEANRQGDHILVFIVSIQSLFYVDIQQITKKSNT